jgi:hypothetical protein
VQQHENEKVTCLSEANGAGRLIELIVLPHYQAERAAATMSH